MNRLSFLLALLVVSVFTSCKEEELNKYSALTLNFSYEVENTVFKYGDTYTNSMGNKYSINLWRTYLSNIVLVSDNGSEYKVSDSYHLIEPQSAGVLDTVLLAAVPNGNYVSIRFNIGIAEEANLSKTLVGDLDPSNNMAWNWIKGYKFIRVDGEFTDLNENRRGLVIHIGTAENLKSLAYTFSSPIVLKGQEQEVNFSVDLASLFEAPNVIDFEVVNDFQFNAESNLIAENYADGYIVLTDD